MKQRITWPDTAKALGIFLVFWGHLLEKTFPNELTFQFYKAIYAFHIPMFFLLAGVFFRRREQRFAEQLISHGKSRLGPVLFFTLLSIPLSLLPASSGLDHVGQDWHNISRTLWMLLQGFPVANWATWFLVCLFTVEMIAFELVPFLATRRQQWTAIALLAGLAYLLVDDPFAAADKLGIRKNWWFLQEAIVALPFYLLGHYLAGIWLRPRESLRREMGLAMLLTAGWVLTYNLNMQDAGPPSVNMSGAEHGRLYFFYTTAMLGSVALFQWARLIPFNRLINYIGRNTLPLIGLNGLLLQYINAPLAHRLTEQASGAGLVILLFVAAAACLLACLPLVWVLNRWVPLATGQWRGFPAGFWYRLAPRRETMTAWIALAALWLMLACYVQPGTNLRPGLDSSWAYALNYIAHQGLVMGKDITFTFGPLGFLDHTRHLSDALIYGSSVFWAIISFLLFFNLLSMVRDSWAVSGWISRAASLVAMLTLAIYLDDQVQRLMMLVYVLAMRSAYTGRKPLLWCASTIATLSLMVKFSYGVTTFAYLGIFWLIHAWQHRDIKTPVIAGAAALATYLLGWLVIYGSTAGTVGYILGGLEFSRGSVSAMAQAPEHQPWAIAAFYACFALAWLAVASSREHRREHMLLVLPFTGPLFIWTRYAFGREDVSHLILLYCFAFYSALLLIPYIRSLGRKIIYGTLMAASLPVWYYILNLPVMVFIDTQPEIVYRQAKTIRDQFSLRWLIDAWDDKSRQELAPLVLPDDMRARVGNETVDIYPWENLVTAANHFNWQPRPVFQNYITYTPKLDALNAAFFADTHRPHFIVWHRQPFQDIDNRYPFSANPLTLEGILRWYKPIMHSDKFHLLEAQEYPQLSAPIPFATGTGQWDTWIDVPEANADIIKLNLRTGHTLTGSLVGALWKEGQVYIDYRLKSGRVITHRVVLDNAINGLWISPYLDDITPPAASATPIDPATAQQYLGLRQCEGYIENVDMRASLLQIDGWAACTDRNTDGQETFILLDSATADYLVPASVFARPGITDYFGMTGKFNLENSGFSAQASLASIQPGTYTAYMLTRVNGEMAISKIPHPGIVVTAESPSHLNVQAIRLHSSTPWAFDDELSLEWTAYQFLGEEKYF